ncbi:complex I 24 kDa subunit family protein [Papillibacter cinnamivorans]|uniref:NAD(P)-dependent iron-only hydrogenase diaphorase component iron-sulfur protein n=1 Tax=Papillibacter cinnamivorans DSM 12816 TaxID=1122930 RepID=A0A1W2A4G3_9FIRM|nr:NAD(P)H-dependent oxidoreductase subunit E [Papillibacter cinnamivorans]SMC55567.1 NAD(P)-dependent iron-only hydrogenase diaphorase component iron-sulfur protein [Papillibacter cinnamivorans DSM 12816]
MTKQPSVPFHGTKEQEERLKKVFQDYKDVPGALMPILQEAQQIYGYLPIEVQKMVAEEMKISLEEVYGVVTFYTQFSLYPKGKYSINVCLGTACYVRGSGPILEKFKEALGIDIGECTSDGKFSLDATRCIGACGLSPVCMVNEDVYAKLTVDDVEKILAKY